MAYSLESQGGVPANGTHVFGFEVGEYDRSLPLVLDPANLIFCGYIGGNATDYGYGLAVDGSGNVYVTGLTQSTEATFPVTAGPGLTRHSDWDAFVAKVNADGTSLSYCGYIGGDGSDGGYGIAVDGSGSAYITGVTSSNELTFPVAVGPDLIYNGYTDAFVAKVDAAGTDFIYCGYIGGSGYDAGRGIAVDHAGHAYIVGDTNSTEATFPLKVGPGLVHRGGRDGFVAKVNAAGTDLVYSGYIGGAGDDYGVGISEDGWGFAYVVGYTRSAEDTFPVLVGPGLTYNGNDYDVFVAKIWEYDIPSHALTSLMPSLVAAGGADLTISVFGTDFVDGAIVLWDRANRPTTFISDHEVKAQIGAADLKTGKVVEVAVMNPDGGLSSFLEFVVTTFSLGASPASTTVTAGQSATYSIQVTPQYGPFDSAISFSARGLPKGCQASFLPTEVTPGADPASAMLTLATTARSAAARTGVISTATGSAPLAAGPAFLGLAVFLWGCIQRRVLVRRSRRWLAAGAIVCLIILGRCSAREPSIMATPAGTYEITIEARSGSLTASQTVTLVVR